MYSDVHKIILIDEYEVFGKYNRIQFFFQYNKKVMFIKALHFTY